MASAVLRGLVESGALVASAGGWSIEPLALDSLQSSSQAAELLMRRLELLPAQAIRLLSGAAVLGKDSPIDVPKTFLTSPLQSKPPAGVLPP